MASPGVPPDAWPLVARVVIEVRDAGSQWSADVVSIDLDPEVLDDVEAVRVSALCLLDEWFDLGGQG